MERKVKISPNDLGNAIVGLIARKCKGITDMPFAIQQASVSLDAGDQILVTFSDESAQFERSTGKKGKHYFPHGRTVTLSREAVFSALAYEIAFFILALPARKVVEVSPELPEKIRVRLRHAPKGASAQHCFDGKLPLNE